MIALIPYIAMTKREKMMKPIHIALACFVAPILGWSQYGVLDTTFNGTGYNYSGQGTYHNEATTVFQQADGGVMSTYTNSGNMGISRFLPEGVRDTAFHGGQTYNYHAYAAFRAPCIVLEQPDGKLMLAGRGRLETNAIRFIRFLPDGEYDISFGPDGEVTNSYAQFSKMVLCGFKRLDDGRMLVAGTATSDADRMFLARFLADGSPDLSFNGTGLHQYDVLDTAKAYDMEVRPDGRVLLAGYAQAGQTRKLALLQVSAEGIPDPIFGTNGIVTTDLGFLGQELRAISLGADGSILGCGFVESAVDDRDALLVRYDPTGALDPTFDSDGWSTKDFGLGNDMYNDVLIEDDGMVLVTGASAWPLDTLGLNTLIPKLTLERYFPDGTAETSFGTNGSIVMGFAAFLYGSAGTRLALQADGKVLVAGYGLQTLYSWAIVVRFTGGSPVSVAEIPASHKVIAYPNPSSGQLQLDLPSIQKEWEVRFMDTNGRLVKRERIRGADRAMFDVRSLAPGAYQVLLQAEGERYRATFVKMP